MIAKITKRITALVLCLLMVASVLTSVPMFTAAAAVADDPAPADIEGLETKKTVTDNGNGTYTISLESWTTGTVTVTTQTMPMDIVLVLDQSGSMEYKFGSSGTRQKAMKQAVNSFIDEVNKKFDAETSDHRISIVTFGSSSSVLNDWTFVNDAGKTALTGSINGLTDSPSGSTRVDSGMNNANTQLTASNSNYSGKNTNRQKIVIVFTDGVPTASSNFQTKVATDAISIAKSIKDTGAKIYTIGIFNGANPGELYGEYFYYLVHSNVKCNGNVGDVWGGSWAVSLFEGNDFNDMDVAAGNRFLNYLSSNFLSATEIGIEAGSYNPEHSSLSAGDGYKITKNITRDSSDYYFKADNQDSLNNVFTTISQSISTATVEIGENAEVRDVVTPYFDLPANTSDIKVYTADFNGTGFEERVASSLTPTVSGNTVSVKGFDFDANCVTSEKKADNTYGKKLIVEFTITPKEGFLGGSNVPTNESGSGIMVKEDGKDVLIEDFVPKYPDGGNGVSVPLPETGDFTVTAKDKYVYLNGGLTTDDMLENASFTYGAQTIDISPANNYGLETWQNAYANIEIKTSDAMTDVTEDDIFSISVIVTDKGDAENVVEASAEKNVYVLMPTAAFEDDEVIYGEKAVISDNASVEWKYGEKTDTALKAEDADVIGTAPEIAFTYAPVNTADGTVTSDDTAAYFTPNGGGDFGIKVATAKIDETDIMNKINFAHTDCEDGEELPSGAQFIVHSEACVLTVTKKVVNSASSKDEAFIVKISDDAGSFSKTVVLKADESITIEGLPIGDYTVTEDTNWAWRYEASYEGFTNAASRTVSLTADSIDGSVTITNSKVINRWLDFCDSVDNFFKDLGGAD